LSQTLPICLDFGTDNEKLLADPLYLGLRQRRLPEEVCIAFVEKFMAEMNKTFPNMIIQFEDFKTPLAFPLLAQNRDKYPCFNDDIQGTGSVVLAGVLRAFVRFPPFFLLPCNLLMVSPLPRSSASLLSSSPFLPTETQRHPPQRPEDSLLRCRFFGCRSSGDHLQALPASGSQRGGGEEQVLAR
jgi:hypothetical protein